MNNELEIWKDVPGFEGSYQCSNIGRIKSLGRVVAFYNGRKRQIKERILKLCKNKNGYYAVGLSGSIIQVHQIVAMTFLGHKRCGFKLVVDHINNEPLDNRVENLQITTNRHNTTKDAKGMSKYTGVCFHKTNKRWNSQIRISGKKVHLGYYSNEYDAHLAYQKKLNELNNQ